MNTETRVLIVHNIVSPHVTPYFERLAEMPDIDLTVWFLAESSSSRKWETTISGRYHAEVLSGWSLEVQRQEKEQYIFNPSILWKLCRSNFDVVVVCGWDSPSCWLTVAMARLRKIPLVLWSGSTGGSSLYGDQSTTRPKGLRRLVRPIVKWHVDQASTFVAYGTRAKRYLQHLGASPGDIYCAWNTVDLERLTKVSKQLRNQRDSLRRRIGIGEDQVLILYVGRFQPFKRVENLITAYGALAESFPSAILVLVGYGPCEPQLRDQVDRLPVGKVIFSGHIELNRMPEYYSSADIFVLPSADIWGLVINEAMACGLPVIAADSVGSTDDLVIHRVTGFIFPHHDVHSLYDYLHQLATNKALREQMGAAAETHVCNFTYDEAVRSLALAVRQANIRGRKT